MAKNLIRKVFNADGTFVAPAGVTSVKVRTSRNNIQLVTASNNFTLAIDSSGAVYGWGDNQFGQLGDNTVTARSSPVLMLGGRTAIQVGSDTGTGFFIEAVTQDAYGTGRAQFGELGDNTTTNKSNAVILSGGRKFRNVGTGGNAHSAYVQTDGSALGSGFNADGRLGDNTITNSSSPVLVAGGRKFRQVSAGDSVGCGIIDNGDAYTWGSNTAGILGTNSATNTSSPVLVVGGKKFDQISCAGGFMIGLATDGSAYCWGDNSSGQLGDNTTTNRSSPVAVVGGHKFIRITSGNANAMGLKSNGEIWSWGTNGNGTIGDNTTTNRSSPVLVVGGHSFVQMNKGSGSHAVAVRADGAILCWGANSSGMLGDNTTTNRSSPVVVVGSRVWKAASAEQLNQSVVPVVPGTSYPIAIFASILAVGSEPLGAGSGQTSIELEYLA